MLLASKLFEVKRKSVGDDALASIIWEYFDDYGESNKTAGQLGWLQLISLMSWLTVREIVKYISEVMMMSWLDSWSC